jgi:hypothetical protein
LHANTTVLQQADNLRRFVSRNAAGNAEGDLHGLVTDQAKNAGPHFPSATVNCRLKPSRKQLRKSALANRLGNA